MCFDADSLPPDLPVERVLAPLAGGAGAEPLTLTSGDGTVVAAALARSPQPSSVGVVILPDVRGLYRFYAELAERFAEAGHHAIALDYFGRTAGAQERDDDFEYLPHVKQTTVAGVQADIAAAIAALKDATGVERVVTVGFCFGGSQSFLAAANPSLDLDAVIGFYGGLRPRAESPVAGVIPPVIDVVPEFVLPVLGLFGGADEGIPPDQVQQFDAALGELGIEHEVVTYEGAPHSFFDRRYEEHAEACADAWRRMLDFLGQVGAKTAA
jgi:carboxymethylenebutenolidase